MPLRFTLALLLALAAPVAPPARADEACALAARLMQIDALSHRASTATSTQAAARMIDQMMAEIRQIPSDSGRLIADELSGYDLAAFLDSRSRMALVFSDRGLAAAQRHIADPAYGTRSQGVRSLGALLECADNASRTDPVKSGFGGVLTRPPDARARSISRITGAERLATQGIKDAKTSLQILGVMVAALAIFALVARRRPQRRREVRYLCDIPTQVAAGGETMRARIIDISTRGAKLMISHNFRKRQPGTITLGRHGEVPFRVVWTNQNYAGIRFRARLAFPLPHFIQETGVKRG